VPRAGKYPDAGANQPYRVLTVVPFDEEDESPLVGLLQVEAADAQCYAQRGDLARVTHRPRSPFC
jgi:hypothetical protein